MFLIEVLVNIHSKYLWGDESFTFHIIQHSFINIINLTAQDVHPFIYYFIAKISTIGINNIFIKIFILKLTSTVPYLILLIIGNTYIKKNFSTIASKLFMLCIISMPLLIDNISQVRMYGWATLFTTIFYIFIISTYNKNNMRRFVMVSLFALLSSYTHYYALIVVMIIYLIFIILFIINKKSLTYLFYSILINIILYLPWIFILFNQIKKATNNYWSNKIQINDVFQMIIGIISPVYHISFFYIFPILLIICLVIIILNKTIYKDKIFLLNIVVLITPFILILFGTLISLLIGRSFLLSRYITPAMGIFWLSISIIISKINNKHKILKYLLMIIIIISSLVSYIKTTKHNINMFNESDKSVKLFTTLPKASYFIYNNSEIMYSLSVYRNNNSILAVPNADTSFPIYNKTFQNIKNQNNIKLPPNKNNIFYIENTNNVAYNSHLSNKFNKKYKKIKIAIIDLPADGSANIYKILK